MKRDEHRKLEWIERRAFADLVGAVPPARRAALGLEARQHGGALALRCREIDSPLFNRVIGLGMDRPADRAQLQELLSGYRNRFFVHLSPEARPATLPELLRAAGLERYRRAWHKLGRGPGAPLPAAHTDLEVRLPRPDQALDVGWVLAAGFDLAAAGAEVFASVVGRKGWHCYVACDAATIASVGLLYVERGIGYLAGGATHPQHRRRGGQGALMAARVRRALELGCTLIGSETGAPAPGDPQHSHRNMERCGLSLIGVRENWAPRGTTWNHGARAPRTPA